LLLLRLRRTFAAATASTATTTSAATAGALALRLLRLLRLALLQLLLLLLVLWTLRTFTARRAWSAIAIAFARRALSRRTAFILAPLLAGPLLELLHFPLHELALLCVLFGAQFVVPAIRAAFPTFGIGLLAG